MRHTTHTARAPGADPRLLAIGLLLLGALCLTRPQQFAAAVHLPDATVAVFLLAGCYLRRMLWFLLLFAVVVLLDTFSIRFAGAGSHCITVSYCFLLPAYAAPWVLGRCLAAAWAQAPPRRQLHMLSLHLLAAASLAFLFSDGSFYLWSGHFQPTWGEYLSRAAHYYPRYLLAPWGYALLGWGAHALCRACGAAALERP